jgi:S-adenosylmethionine:tRNA ribosyltransferase-isomerase
MMRVNEFDYHLPPELIAQSPARNRDSSRLMALERSTGAISHRLFSDLPEYLHPGDVLVVNDTRVYPARLIGIKSGTGGAVEALLIREVERGVYLALMKGAPRPGTRLVFGDTLSAVVEEDAGEGKRVIRFAGQDGLDEAIDSLGRMPLPPYIDQSARDEIEDRERYQTVYATKRGALAAPTAGLHFTPELLSRVEAAGVDVVRVTLHVGLGTFMPVRVERVADHVMESEAYEVSPQAAARINSARAAGGRVVAVGTTTTRTLESAFRDNGVAAGCLETNLFIYPGYEFRAVDALVTNFHLPKSTLIMLVSAFAGRGTVLKAYNEAVIQGYRFYSYGDAMLIY